MAKLALPEDHPWRRGMERFVVCKRDMHNLVIADLSDGGPLIELTDFDAIHLNSSLHHAMQRKANIPVFTFDELFGPHAGLLPQFTGRTTDEPIPQAGDRMIDGRIYRRVT